MTVVRSHNRSIYTNIVASRLETVHVSIASSLKWASRPWFHVGIYPAGLVGVRNTIVRNIIL